MTHQQIDKLWNEREAFRKLSEDLQKELEKVQEEKEALKTVVQDLRNVVAAQGLKNFGN